VRFRTPEPLSERLLEAVKDCLSGKGREPISIEVVRSTKRHVSQVHQVRVCFRSEPAPVLYWVKLHSDNPGGALEEFAFLSNAREKFRSLPMLDVVTAVAYLDEFDALVTEHTSGPLLSSHVKRHANRISSLVTDQHSLQKHFHLCGVWLATLHQPHESGAQYYPREDLLEYVDERLRRLLSEPDQASLYDRVKDFLERSLAETPSEDLVRVKTHGDYAPYNVLLRGDDLVVFDPSVGLDFGRLENYCARYEDVLHFYNWTSYMFGQIVSDGTRRELVRQFLEGYNQNAAFLVDPSSTAFRIFWLKHKLFDALDTRSLQVTVLSSRNSRVSRFRKWFEQVTDN